MDNNNIRLPNKVVITTRFRDFKGDYPVEIVGMTEKESFSLINRHAKILGIYEKLKTVQKIISITRQMAIHML